MPKIIDHWWHEGIKFDAISTGYIGYPKQFNIILDAKEKLLKEDGLVIVDPAMADQGKL
jgi:pyridoxine kinase